jgi:hypothetical protein
MHHKTPFPPKTKPQFFVGFILRIALQRCEAMRKCALCDIKKNNGIEFAKFHFNFLIKVQGRNIHCFATRLKTAVAVTNHEDMASSSLSAEGANKRSVKWATGGWPPSPILPRSEALLRR